MDEFHKLRAAMVEEQIRSRGIRDEPLLDAMGTVPRHFFVDRAYQTQAYEDRPLPIGSCQTISQPYIVALMVELLKLDRHAKVLEVGAGSGYAAAILAQITQEVYAIERIQQLAEIARRNLKSAGYPEVDVRCADGTMGWPDRAPFDAILVSAGATETPMTLAKQLKIGGRLVVPVGPGGFDGQELIRVTRTSDENFIKESFGGVRFVPLIGDSPDCGTNVDTTSRV